MTKDKIYDVCVIGAGPAGCRISEILSNRGISVLVLEKKKRVGIPVQCGEGVSFTFFNRLNMPQEVVKKELKGSKIIMPNGSSIVFPRKGFSIRRNLFDQILFERSVKAGADIYLETPVVDLKWKLKFWEIYSNYKVFRAKFLVGADGPLSVVRRILARVNYYIKMRSLFAMEYKYFNDNFSSDYFIFYNRKEYYPGYAWIFDRGDEVSVGLGRVYNVKDELDKFVKDRGFINFKRKNIIGGFIPSPSHPPVVTFKNGIFIGDAGGFVHPIVKGGIIGAIFSAEKGAEVLLNAVKYRDDIIYEFSEYVKEHASRDPLHYFLVKSLPKLSNKSLEYFGNLLDNRYYKDFPLYKGIRLILKNFDIDIIKAIPLGILFQVLYSKSESLAW